MINEQDYNNLKRNFEELKREFYRTKIGNTTVITGSTKLSELTLADGGNIAVGISVGTQIGSATAQKLAFHGSTPVIQRVGAAQNSVATTGATNSTPYGYSTAAQADAIVTLVNELRAALVAKGLIKGSV